MLTTAIMKQLLPAMQCKHCQAAVYSARGCSACQQFGNAEVHTGHVQITVVTVPNCILHVIGGSPSLVLAREQEAGDIPAAPGTLVLLA